MTVKLHSYLSVIFIISTVTSLLHTVVNCLGSASTVAVTYSIPTACGIVAGEPTQRIQCYQNGQKILIRPNISFEAISGGKNFLCGLRSGGLSVLCWETSGIISQSTPQPRLIYYSKTTPLTDLTVGSDQVCAREVNYGVVYCWRGRDISGSLFPSPGVDLKFSTITSGSGFTCGILSNDSTVHCWGGNDVGAEVMRQFGNLTMSNLVAGDSHACGLTRTGVLVCKGQNESGQLKVPFSSPFEFSGVAAGANFTCAIKQRNGLVTCWGGANKFQLWSSITEDISFESIAAGSDFICGLTTGKLSMICWGLGWSKVVNQTNDIPMGMIIPGPCVRSSCNSCGMYPNSEALCDGSGSICKSCQVELPLAVPLQPGMPQPTDDVPQPLPSRENRGKLSWAFLIVGSVGTFAGICAIAYCLSGFLRKKNRNSMQPLIVSSSPHASLGGDNDPVNPLIPFSGRGNGSRLVQRSISSSRRTDKTEIFPLSELLAATNNFSLETKIGAGSFGIVYRGELADGREVAIKRGVIGSKRKQFQEKETAFDSELALLSRLHHKHLVGLIGFCEEKDERLLVYEYMSNRALHDHLHGKNNNEKSKSVLNTWKMRIKIALDAARGIEYLHKYAVPSIIHRDIKSSNILLDSNWTAKVSDFGLSLMKPESGSEETVPTKTVGTVGYIDPEYYALNTLTVKSDVYGFGVVLLELLTGKRAVFMIEEDSTGPMGVVEYAVPLISSGKLQTVLDRRVGLPEMHEANAVELLAYTALHCVNLEGKERPNIVDIVANLERALALCEEIPSFSTSIPSH